MFCGNAIKNHGLSVVKLKLLRAAKWKSALFQTRHGPHHARPFLNSLGRVEMKISSCFPLHGVVSVGHTSAMSRIIYVAFKGS